MAIERVNFITEDKVILEGLIFLPKKKTNEIIINVHGMVSNCLKRRDEKIAKKVNMSNVAYLTFNNRGHDIVSKITREDNSCKNKNELGGTAYENIFDSYFDIKGAINKVIKLGYSKIHLQGHSLGCTKIVYAYNKLKENNENEILDKIKSVILLSLVDIPNVIRICLKGNFDMTLDYLLKEEKEGRGEELIPNSMFIHPMSVKTFLQYLIYNDDFNFAQYSNEKYQYQELNNIDVNIFMRWGSVNELIFQKPEYLKELMKSKIQKDSNKKVDIDYIEGTGHNYKEKLDELANQINNFIK